MSKILLIVPPFFTPYSPPLGVALLKAYLERRNHQVTCVNLNVEARLWNMHHQYFKLINETGGSELNGYTLYWFILNPHMLAFINGASQSECLNLLDMLFDVYALPKAKKVTRELHQLVTEYFTNLQMMVHDLLADDYNVVGTSTYTTSLASALLILQQVKQHNPQIMTLMGGGVFADDLALGTENLGTLINEYAYVDKVIIGEGELLFERLLEGDFGDKRVISLTDVSNQTLPVNESVTPDFSDFELEGYYHLIIEGSRSCPFQCKFCSERIQWGPYRKKDPKYLARQLMELKNKYERKTFFMGDSIINFYVDELARELLHQNAEIFFDGYLRAEPHVMDRTNTALWAQAGLYRVRMGMESASPHVLKLMDKRITPENMRECVRSLAEAGVRPTTYWVVGFPGETEEDFCQTLEFIRENHEYIYEVEAHPYYYYPTGQRISSNFEYTSLYPDEVNRLIRFKNYDIANPNPTKEERFERLKRVSDLCNELGIINIYSLTDLFMAEDRWLSLHPEAHEIYE